jgi:hypothetical protein
VVWLVTAGVFGVDLYVGQEVGLHAREQKGAEEPSKRLMRSFAFGKTAFGLQSGSLASNGETTR